MDRQRLIYLIKRSRQGKCSISEKAELYELMQNPSVEQEMLTLWDQLQDEKPLDVSEDDSNRLYDKIRVQTEANGPLRSNDKLQRRIPPFFQKVISVAALLTIFFVAYMVTFHPISEDEVIAEDSELHAEVTPGSKKARIVFEDGTYQELGNGAAPNSNHMFRVGKEDGVSYVESFGAHEKATIHTLITPVGGEYVIRLNDGTKVWLNANSSLKYPVSFSDVDIREVELEGEAYFDVAKLEIHGKRIPFVVKSQGQILKVLGTEFNINTFRDKVTTTLVEGSVQVSFDGMKREQPYVLKPNDQAIYDSRSKQTNIVQIDPYYVTAWKNGDFAFDNAPLKNVMEDISRWYDVEIEYKTGVNDIRFSGKVSKFESIETLLQTIEWTGSVKLKLDGRRITVMK